MLFDYEVVFEATRNLVSGGESSREAAPFIGGFYSGNIEETYYQNCRHWNEFLERLNAGTVVPSELLAEMPDNFYFVEEFNGLIYTRGRLNVCKAIRRNKEQGVWVEEFLSTPQVFRYLPSPPECEELW